MSIKTLVLAASMLLAFSSVSVWAASHEKAEEAEEVAKCIIQADLDAMSDEDKAKVELPVCDEATAAAMEAADEADSKDD